MFSKNTSFNKNETELCASARIKIVRIKKSFSVPLSVSLKVVSATFLLLCFVCLKESTLETRKKKIYFTSKALFVLEIIKFAQFI